MKFIRNLIALFALLQLVSNAQAFFAGPYYGGYGPYYGGWGYGPGWGKGYAIGAGIGAAGGIIGSAITADAIKKSQPGYWEYKADKEAREAQERAERRGYGYRYRN